MQQRGDKRAAKIPLYLPKGLFYLIGLLFKLTMNSCASLIFQSTLQSTEDVIIMLVGERDLKRRL
jgi:hypothetical protein